MARRLAAENEDWFDVDQYDNLANPEGHFRTLGPEVWMQTEGKVTHFVAGGSTGGTISGTGKFLKVGRQFFFIMKWQPCANVLPSPPLPLPLPSR